MADVFLSYAREDRQCAALFAQKLAQRGWTVWWDRQAQIGRSFSDEIERELELARCVIVLWSRSSVTSDWVKGEASEAMNRRVIVPIRIEEVRVPLEFRRLQTADVFDWHQSIEGDDFEACLRSIVGFTGRTPDRTNCSPADVDPPDLIRPSTLSVVENINSDKRSNIARNEADDPKPKVFISARAPDASDHNPITVVPTSDVLAAYVLPAVLGLILAWSPLGFVSIFYIVRVNERVQLGDMKGASHALLWAKRWRGIAVIVAIVIFIVTLSVNSMSQ